MSPPVTEIAYITLKPGTDISGSSDAAKAWKEGLSIISKQAGYQRSRYGITMESPELLMWFIDWDSVSSHKAFEASSDYTTFGSLLSTLMTTAHFHHISFSPFPPSILTTAPVIEFVTFLDTTPSFPSNVSKFMSAVGIPDGCYGGVWGESIETDIGKHEDGILKGRVVVLAVGWESKDAHLRFTETEKFNENIGLLGEGLGGVEMFHVPFTAA
ncbi:uncharacterized protein RAG0_01093 [Rhynchosporium agropyri]|uniref:ABM domain-containing protein n=1 Tax=Rhynchosporium agropyri TaxID=914238 RepID=A0A1E1JVD3_9HELO|nr:uncharacterized protein RAG0_01093 [Rhynchosporium agropyri]